jgi:transposase InsO family protein
LNFYLFLKDASDAVSDVSWPAHDARSAGRDVSSIKRALVSGAAVREWIAAVGAKTAYIMPGSPWENGYCESFNSKLRDELLNGVHIGGSQGRHLKLAASL